MPIEILKHQADFLESTAVHTGLVAGFGGGKSIAATLKCIEMLKQYPKTSVAYYLPTYDLIRQIAFKNFKHYFTEMGIPFELNETAKEFRTPIGNVIMRSIEKHENIVGYEVAYSVIDEADIPSLNKMNEVFIKVIGRNRTTLPDGSPNMLDFVSTPEGFKFVYHFFVKQASERKRLIQARTKDNPFISDSYIKSLEETYTPERLRAYLDGEFVNLTSGAVYNHFDRNANHTDRWVDKGDILHVGMDFNVGAMAAIVHVIDKGVAYAVDEVVNAYKTEDICEILKWRYPDHRIFVYPDASGKNQKTNASKTDIDILKSYGFNVRALNSNPNVKDRVNTMNKKFQDNSYLVNTYKCPTFTDCLEQLPYKNGEPDKSVGLDHPPDAAGYFIWHEFGKRKSIVLV